MTLPHSLPALLIGALSVVALPFSIALAETPSKSASDTESSPTPSPAAVVNMINNCFSCHGTDGRSPGAIPSLTNMNEQQALLVLKELKSGARANTVMTRHAKGYTDAELEALAKYIAENLK